MPINLNKNNLMVTIFIGIVIGTIYSVSPVTFAMTMIMLLICVILWKLRYPRHEKLFLLRLFLWGCTIRIVICLAIYLISAWHGGEGSLFQDDVGWPRAAWKIYLASLGKFDFAAFHEQLIKGGQHSVNLKEHYLILISLLFSVARYYTPLIAKYINIILSCLTAIIIYDLSREIINQKTAKISSTLTMFMPSLLLWSIVALKETSFIFLIVLNLWALTKFLKTKKWYFILLLTLPLLSIYSIRDRFIPIIIISIGISFFLAWRINLLKKMCSLLIGGIIIISILFVSLGDQTREKIEPIHTLNAMFSSHKGFYSSGGAVYKLFDDRFYEPGHSVKDMALKDILSWYIKGTLYFTFSPMPWDITSARQSLFIPQIIIWYAVFPFILIGIISSLRFRGREIFPIIFFLFLATSIYSLAEGNIGIAVRHRDALTPFYLIFAAVGIRKVFGYQFLKSQENSRKIHLY